MRAVVVTNDPNSLADIRRSWAGEGIQTEVLTAIEGACHAIEQGRADLVLLDSTLPWGDALALHAKLRAQEQATTLPIIFRTSDVGDYFIPPDAGPDALAALGRGILCPDRSDSPNGSANRRGATAGSDGWPSRHEGAEGGTIPSASESPRLARQARTRALRGRAARSQPGKPFPVGAGTVGALARTGRGRRVADAGSEMAILPFLLRWSWLLVLTILLGLAGGFVYLQTAQLPYQSTALLVVRPQSDGSGTPMVSSNPARISLSAQALARQADSPTVYRATSRALAGQMEISSDDVGSLVTTGRISITPLKDSGFISIVASDEDPQRAWLLADGYRRGFLADLRAQATVVAEQEKAELEARIDILQKQLAAIPSGGNSRNGGPLYDGAQSTVFDSLIDAQTRLRMLSQPQAPLDRYGDPSEPTQTVNQRRILLASAAAGAVCGLVLAYLLELLRRRFTKKARRTAPSPSRSGFGTPHSARGARLASPGITAETNDRPIALARAGGGNIDGQC